MTAMLTGPKHARRFEHRAEHARNVQRRYRATPPLARRGAYGEERSGCAGISRPCRRAEIAAEATCHLVSDSVAHGTLAQCLRQSLRWFGNVARRNGTNIQSSPGTN